MAARNVDVEGINYYTLYELPDSQNESAPCVLLVHALMSNLHMYDATVRALHQAGYATLRYDHVGHHNTPPPPSRTTSQRRMSIGESTAYHMDDLTRHMHQLVKHRTGQTRVKAVIGCSIGGVLAVRYAMMFPDEVESIISLAAPGFTSEEDKKPLWTQRIEQFEEDQKTGDDKLCHATVQRWFPGERTEEDAVRAESLKHVQTCSLEGYKLLADAIRNYDYDGQLDQMRGVQCLVAGGTEDGAISLQVLKDAARQMQGATYVEFDQVGHLPPMQKPQEFNKVMLEFLGQA